MRFPIDFRGIIASSVLLFTMCGCNTVPPLWHATNNLPFSEEIDIHNVVQRVKCELADALDKKTQDPRFKWMASWTVKADLTLQTNETGGITPNASIVVPLRNAYNIGAGPSSVSYSGANPGTSVAAIAQNFSFGLGATYANQVYRTETVSFSLSLAELRAWREGPAANLDCAPVGSTDLEGNLDLGPWINAALNPVSAGDLVLGIHPSPGSGATAKAKLGGTGAPPELSPEAAARMRARVKYHQQVAEDMAKQARASAEAANAAMRDAGASAALSERVKKKIRELAMAASADAVEAQLAADWACRRSNPSAGASDRGGWWQQRC